jgi:hypothetical protein
MSCTLQNGTLLWKSAFLWLGEVLNFYAENRCCVQVVCSFYWSVWTCGVVCSCLDGEITSVMQYMDLLHKLCLQNALVLYSWVFKLESKVVSDHKKWLIYNKYN